MISEEQEAKIIYFLNDYIYNETGINIDEYNFELEISDNKIIALIKNFEFSEIDYEEEDFNAADLAIELIEQVGDVKRKLVEIKILELEEAITEVKQEITDYLKTFLGESKINDISIDIEEFGYDYKHWETDDEAESGYPEIGLLITDYENIDFRFPLNIYSVEEPLEIEQFREEFEQYYTNIC